MFLNSAECFIENRKYQCFLCRWEVKARPKWPTTSTAEPGSDRTPSDSSTVLLWHLMCSSSCHHPRVWKERDRHFTPDFVLVKELWWVSPTLLCATAPFGLYPSLVTLVTEIVFLFYFLVLNCCKTNWKTSIMYRVSFFCLHILGLFCLHVFIFPLLIFSFIAFMKLLFSIFMSAHICEKPNKIFHVSVSS